MGDLTILEGVVCGIRQRIVQGVWAPGAKLPTREELADIFQASSSTVQVAIRSLVADGSLVTRKRAGTCVCNNPPECSRFALVTSSNGLGDPKKNTNFIDALHKSAARVATLHPGFRIDSFAGGDPRLQEMIQANAVAGIVYFGPPHVRPQVENSGIPLATFHFPGQHVAGDVSISMKYKALLELSLEILCKRGHTRIGIFEAGGYSPASNSGQRSSVQLAHLFRSVESFGGSCAPGWIQIVNPLNQLAVYQAALLLLGNPNNRPRALILLDDHFLPGVVEAIQDLGLTIPTEVDVCVLAHDRQRRYTDGCTRLGFDSDELIREVIRRFKLRRQKKDAPVELEVELAEFVPSTADESVGDRQLRH